MFILKIKLLSQPQFDFMDNLDDIVRVDDVQLPEFRGTCSKSLNFSLNFIS